MQSIRAFVAVLGFTALAASAADGLVMLKSPLPPKATLDKFESIAKERGLTGFARIDPMRRARPRSARACGRPSC